MKRILSGITPSGDGTLHIGNYLGAVKQFIDMARANECFLFVADLHALTTVQNKKQLQENVENLILNELALLGDLKNITFFRQSDIGFHAELQTILNNVTPLGLIRRAHAYKDKLEKNMVEDDVNMGLFCYPVLMAADILIYKPDLVPVGKDQKQHIEIARDIAERFNRVYKKQIFKLPDGYIPEDVATILGTDGKRKMSKSLGNIISIFEPEEIIRKQVMSTYTDPTRLHATDPGHVEGNMVFTYLDFFGNKNKVDQMKQAYTKGQIADIEVKEYLFESLIKFFAPARKRYEELKNNPELVKETLARGAEKAKRVARETIKEVKETIGLVNAYSFSSTSEQSRKIQGLALNSSITIDDFSKIEIRVGKVEQAEYVEKSEKLIRLHVDFGLFGKRTIFTGVRTYGYTADYFSGKQFLFVVNLEPRKMPSYVKTSAGKMVEESQGMILAVDSDPIGAGGKPLFISGDGLPVGAKIR